MVRSVTVCVLPCMYAAALLPAYLHSPHHACESQSLVKGYALNDPCQFLSAANLLCTTCDKGEVVWGAQGVVAAMGRMQAALRIEAGQHAVVSNGRVVTVPRGRLVTPDEFQLMQYVAMNLQPGSKVLGILLAAQESGRTAMTSSEGPP